MKKLLLAALLLSLAGVFCLMVTYLVHEWKYHHRALPPGYVILTDGEHYRWHESGDGYTSGSDEDSCQEAINAAARFDEFKRSGEAEKYRQQERERTWKRLPDCPKTGA